MITSPFSGLPAMYADLDGERGPLIARVRDPTVVLTILERNYIADLLKKPRKRPLDAKAIRERGKGLEIAKTVIRLSNGYSPGQIKTAIIDAAKKHGCSPRKVNEHIQFAQGR